MPLGQFSNLFDNIRSPTVSRPTGQFRARAQPQGENLKIACTNERTQTISRYSYLTLMIIDQDLVCSVFI